jgi:hypothetical protein
MKSTFSFKIKYLLFAFCVLTISLPASVFAADVQVSVSEPEGWPLIAIGGGKAMSSNFAFWGNQWRWDSINSTFKKTGAFKYSVNSQGAFLGLGIQDSIQKDGENKIRWQIDINANKSQADVPGGGVVFNFELDTYRAVMGEPELLPNNAGWVWGKGKKNTVEMRFEPALEAVFFEQSHKNEVRAYFYAKSIPQGDRLFTATLTISGNAEITQTAEERSGATDKSTWIKQPIDWKGSPVDLSFLNQTEIPAGKHGFIKAVGEKLVFNDGSQARFWGTNLTASALFGSTKEDVRQQAKRLSQLGFNLVRLHHHDSPWVNPNIFGAEHAANSTNANVPDPAMMDKLDWWIKCLKDEGIYVWLDMHAQRFLNKGDNITAFDEISRGKPNTDLKGYNYVNPSIQQTMKDFSNAYFGHINTYTGLAYKDEAAIAAILITNENDLTFHYGNSLLQDKQVPWHDEQYLREAKNFAVKTGLNPNQVWRSWEPGPAKYFLNDLENRFNVDMIAYLHSIGVKVPIVTTNTWGNNPLNSLPALTAGDMIDVHSYGGVGELEKNPIYSANIVDWIAAAQVAGKPLSVTEWNVSPYPVAYRQNIPMYIAANASHQGWDTVMLYAYSQEPMSGAGSPSNWHAYNDPMLLATIPAAALMYRQGHVKEATSTYTLQMSKDQFFNQNISPTNSVAIRTATELGKLTIAMPQTANLPWLKQMPTPAGAKIITDPDKSMLPLDATEARSETGELRHNWTRGTYTINTPYTQAAMGWIGGLKLNYSDVQVAVENKNATLSVQALDGKPIKLSKRIYISVMARTQIDPNDHNYFYQEPVLAVLRITAIEGLKLFAAGSSNPLPAPYSAGHYFLNLQGEHSAYLLTSDIPTVTPAIAKSIAVEKKISSPQLSSGNSNPYKLNLNGAEAKYKLKSNNNTSSGAP